MKMAELPRMMFPVRSAFCYFYFACFLSMELMNKSAFKGGGMFMIA